MKIDIKMERNKGRWTGENGVYIRSQKLDLIWIPDLYPYFKIHRTNRLKKYEN